MKLIIPLLFLPLCLYSQKEDLSRDMPFFLKKAALYQRWLDTTGLGQALRVETVQYKINKYTLLPDFTELEFFLRLNTHDLDSAAAYWNQLELDVERSTGRPLNEALFRTYAHMMEVPAAQANIQIHVNDSVGTRIPCFFVWIWDDSGYIRDSVQANACKTQKFEVNVPSLKVQKVQRNGRTNAIKKSAGPEEVYDAVLQFARKRYPYDKYVGTTCSGRVPKVDQLSRTPDELVFCVSDLCREALSNSRLSMWCEMARATGWEKDCNDIRRERLTFSIKYLGTDKGFRLLCRLDGKFGSAAYVPRQNDYFDMDPDFLWFEQDFADKFKLELEQYLNQL
jgi:hypothetical protein